MKLHTIRQRMLAGTMFGSAALMALVAAPALTLLTPATAVAQDYTTGGLAGTVSDQAGAPVGSATVTLRSNEQGFTRSYTTAANGTFRANLIPQGTYEVTVEAPGYETSVDPSVVVRLGGESSYRFTLGQASDNGTQVDEIVVVGTRPELDFSQTTTGLTVDVDELVQRVPIGRSATSVALLAPRVIEGDSAFGSQPSLGGSSVAENAFYLNGLNITNFNTYIGGAPVPFDFYRTIDVKTGGYPAEFGRATGGIINAVTKSGTNDFMFELHGNYSPDSLREDVPNTFSRADYAPSTTLNPGPLRPSAPTARNDLTEVESWSVIAEAGGPIIRDRLYAYGLYQWAQIDQATVNNTGATRTTFRNDIPFYGAKIDAYITDTQRLEFTYFNTEGDYSPVQTRVSDGVVIGGSNVNLGGENYVVRYTGNWTDWLTLSAAYGVNEDQNFTTPLDPTSVQASDLRGAAGFRIPGSNVSATTAFLSTKREFYRADADVTFDFMGAHHVRFGLDSETTTLSRFTQRTGGASYFYYSGDGSITPAGVDNLDVFVSTLGLGGAPISGENKAFYIQDSWDITDDLNLQFGLRHDEFILDNLVGQEVVDLKDNFGPRFAFNLDPFGSGTDKFYGSYGRYFIPVASNLSYRGADLLYDAYFRPAAGNTYTYNADGTPVGGLGTPAVGPDLQLCPTGSPGGSAGLRACLINSDGTVEPADSKYAFGTKATNEDEFIIGYERQLDDLWSVGAAITYRRLNNVSEDIATDYLVRRYCNSIGINCDNQYFGDFQYVIANPGQDLEFLVRETLPNGTRPVLKFSAAETAIPKARREYTGLEVTFDRAYDGVWSLSGSYVLSESIGNYEGTVLSDNGQADAGSTILYDHLGLTEGKYGLLPNHRGHQFKLFGSYTFFDSLTVGMNYSLISPRKFGCLSRSSTDDLSYGYGASAGICRPDILALAGNRDPNSAYTPQGQGSAANLINTSARYANYARTTSRGTVFESDWISTFDLSVRYTLPSLGMRFVPEGVTLRADVFNVFDEQGVTDLVETGTVGSGVAGNGNYGLPSGYQSGRSVRFGFDIAF